MQILSILAFVGIKKPDSAIKQNLASEEGDENFLFLYIYRRLKWENVANYFGIFEKNFQKP